MERGTVLSFQNESRIRKLSQKGDGGHRKPDSSVRLECAGPV